MLAFVFACGPGAPPAPPPRPAAVAVASAEPSRTPPMEAIDVALDDIARLCAKAMTNDGDCVAPTDQLCEAMDRTARACFEASAEPTRCNELMDAVSDHVKARSLGVSTAKVISTFCEATCEVRQDGHRWAEARAALDRVCARRP